MHTQAVTRTAGADASGQVVVQGLLSRSAVNREFRRKLLSDPRAAVAEFAGVDVAQVREPLEVHFVESGGATAARGAARTIVLPQLVEAATELSDAELEAVAGGSLFGGTTQVCIDVLIASIIISGS